MGSEGLRSVIEGNIIFKGIDFRESSVGNKNKAAKVFIISVRIWLYHKKGENSLKSVKL